MLFVLNVRNQTIYKTQKGGPIMERNLMWILKQLHLSLEQDGKNQMRDMDLSPTQGILLYYLLANKEQDV